MDSCVPKLPYWRNSAGRVSCDVRNILEQGLHLWAEGQFFSVISRILYFLLFVILDGSPADAP